MPARISLAVSPCARCRPAEERTRTVCLPAPRRYADRQPLSSDTFPVSLGGLSVIDKVDIATSRAPAAGVGAAPVVPAGRAGSPTAEVRGAGAITAAPWARPGASDRTKIQQIVISVPKEQRKPRPSAQARRSGNGQPHPMEGARGYGAQGRSRGRTRSEEPGGDRPSQICDTSPLHEHEIAVRS